MGAFLGEEPLSRALFAEFLWNHGYKEQSEKEFSEAAKGRPINYRVGELLVQHFFRTGRPPAARQILGVLDKQSSEWSPTEKARIRYFEGQSYFLEKRYQEAIASYEVALSIDPGMFYVHEALGKVFAETGDYDRAIARLRFLLAKSGSALPPQEAAELRVELGQAYEKKNLFVQALSEYFQASKLDPANEMAQKRAAELGKEHL